MLLYPQDAVHEPNCIAAIILELRRTLVLLDYLFSIAQPGSSKHKTIRREV